jgi:hypothetical protein
MTATRSRHRLGDDGKHVEPDAAEQRVLNEIHRVRQSGATLTGVAAVLEPPKGPGAVRLGGWRHVARITKQDAAAR